MSNAEQAEYWAAQLSWVDEQAAMDALLAPVADAVIAAAAPARGQAAIDIGCGTGALSLALADRGCSVTAADIAPPLLALARARADGRSDIALIEADAQSHPFAPADLIVSRFGVMFFADPTAAFANLGRALRPGGRMVLAAWGPAPDNPWFMEPAAAATELLGKMPKVDRTLPGPFAFEDPGRVLPMMRAAGLPDPRVETLDVALPAPDARAAAALCLAIGPARAAIRHFEAGPEDAARLGRAVARRLERFADDAGIAIPARIHLYRTNG